MISLKVVERYIARGFACHWLHGKAPFQQEWSTRPVASLEELRQSYRLGYNLGVRVGKWSVLEPECGLVVLDMDLRDPLASDTCYGTVEGILGHSQLNVASGRGLGGHIYMKCPLEKLPGKAATTVAQGEGWKLELLSTGKNLVVPPSVHPDTGERYKWVHGAIAVVPESLLNTPEVKQGVASSYQVPKPATQLSVSADSWGEGERYNSLFSYAARLQADGWRDDQIRAKVENMNLYRCHPPLEQEEVEAIARSVLRYRKGFNTKGVQTA